MDFIEECKKAWTLQNWKRFIRAIENYSNKNCAEVTALRIALEEKDRRLKNIAEHTLGCGACVEFAKEAIAIGPNPEVAGKVVEISMQGPGKFTRVWAEFVAYCNAGKNPEYHGINFVCMSRKEYDRLLRDPHEGGS